MYKLNPDSIFFNPQPQIGRDWGFLLGYFIESFFMRIALFGDEIVLLFSFVVLFVFGQKNGEDFIV
jgi:hypothetical protein